MTASSATSSATAASRDLVFQEDGSHKFWKIVLNGSSHSVNYGRVGTNGQEQTKEFATDAEAKKSYDKLVAEKVKKGYTDAAGGSTAPAATGSSAAAATTSASTAGPAAPKAAKAAKKATASTAAAAPASAAPTAAAAATIVYDGSLPERSIDLAPRDWARATFRPRQPLTRSDKTRPFDLAAMCDALAKFKGAYYRFDDYLRSLKLPATLSPEESHFWIAVMTSPITGDKAVHDLAAKFRKRKFDARPTVEEVAKGVEHLHYWTCQTFVNMLANAFTPLEILQIICSPHLGVGRRGAMLMGERGLFEGYVTSVLPYLTPEQIAESQAYLRTLWDVSNVPLPDSADLPAEFYFGSLLGLHSEVLELVSSWPDDYLTQHRYNFYSAPQFLFSLGSAALVEQHFRRLKVELRHSADIRAWLACTEYAALDVVRDSVLKADNKDQCEDRLRAMKLVHAAELAPYMLECRLDGKTPNLAREWFDSNEEFGVAGLLPVALGSGRLAEAALDYLRGLNRLGKTAFITAHIDKLTDQSAAEKLRQEIVNRVEKVYAPLDDATTPAELQQAFSEVGKLKPRKNPSWASPAMLPPLTIGDRRLNDAQMETLLNVLAGAPVDQKHPLLVAARRHVDRRSRDEFVWALFQAWLQDGAPTKERWAMGSIGHLGDDMAVLKITPLIRNWPGESQHQRAVFGLECLRAIGSNVALMQLSGIAQKLKFKGLKSRAEECVQEIATEMGLTRAELEDRVIPDCGLDEHGRREFSFGPRSFSFALGPDLKPMLRDADGKLRGDLPKPSGKDDAQQAADSIAEWKLLKKQIRDVASLQAGRLEQAMVVGRRWKIADFETLIVKHPLMKHLARAVIWGAYDASGRRLSTFRVTDEGDYAGSTDDAAALDEAETVGILHPLELSDAERSAWGEVLSDYEIVSPFPQLGRPTYKLSEKELKGEEFESLHGFKVPAPTLVFTLEKLGWDRGPALDGGCFQEHTKLFPAANVKAVVTYDGVVGMGYIDPNEMCAVEHSFIVPGDAQGDWWSWKNVAKLKLSEVSPIVVSEILADLHVLKSKSK